MRKAVKELVVEVVRGRSWDGVAGISHRADVLSTAASIQLADRRHYRSDEVLWRLYFLPVALADECQRQKCGMVKYRELLLDACAELWAAMLLLDPICSHGFRLHEYIPTPAEEHEWQRQVFRVLINWLPELMRLQNRIAVDLTPESLRGAEGDGVEMLRMSWATEILRLSHTFGVSNTIIQLTFRNHDLTGMLIRQGLIRKSGDRFQALV